MHLSELSDLIKANQPFDPARYPGLKDASPDEQMTFGVKHVLGHAIQTLGAFGSVCERADHSGGVPNRDALIRVIISMLVHAHCLGNMINLGPVELETKIAEWAIDKIPTIDTPERGLYKVPEPPHGTSL